MSDAEVYEVDTLDPELILELERQGFRWAGQEGMYHPDHWDAWDMATDDPPDSHDPLDPDVYGIADWAFVPKTDEAREWLNETF